MAMPALTLFGGELLTRSIGQQQVITIDRPGAIDGRIGYDWRWFQGYHPIDFPEKLISIRKKTEKIIQKTTLYSMKFVSKIPEISIVEDYGRRHCDTIRPSVRLILLLHCRSVLRFCIQTVAILQVISSIPKRPLSDIYPITLPSYHQKNKDRISTELNATDSLLLANHSQEDHNERWH